MTNFDLQRFAQTAAPEPVKGKNLLYLIRRYSKRAKQAAQVLAFQTEGSRSISKDADSVATKDGTIRVPGAGEVEISVTSLVTKGDGIYEDLEEAMKSDDLMEIWEINTDEEGAEPNSGKYKAHYFQGYLTSLEMTANSEDFAELSQTYSVNGMGTTGWATLSQEQAAVVQYLFTDTAKVTA